MDSYFRLSSYTLIVTSFVMLVSTGQLDFPSIIIYTAAVISGWLVDGGRTGLSLTRRTTNWLRIAYLPLMLIDWQLLDSAPAIVVIHFILFVSACKLLEQKSTRDWLWLYLVAFFELIMAAGMTIDATFLVLLIVFLFAAISTLISFEIRRAAEAFGSTGGPPNELWRETADERRPLSSRRPFSVMGFSAVALAVILVLATPLFLAMPRIGRAAFGGRLLRTSALSGFSNSVRLGEVASVKLNPQVVMRVRVTHPQGQERNRLRWRGVTFDDYDGQTWTESVQQWQPVRRAGEGFQLEVPVPLAMLTEQVFFLEPLDLSTVFAAPDTDLCRRCLNPPARRRRWSLDRESLAAALSVSSLFLRRFPRRDSACSRHLTDVSTRYPPPLSAIANRPRPSHRSARRRGHCRRHHSTRKRPH